MAKRRRENFIRGEEVYGTRGREREGDEYTPHSITEGEDDKKRGRSRRKGEEGGGRGRIRK